MYYIYHIPGVKIGCTTNLHYRLVVQQNCTDYEVLEIHNDINVASQREIELQLNYGYGKDTINYVQTYSHVLKRADKYRGVPHSEKHKAKMSDAQRAFTPEQVVEIRQRYMSGNITQKELAKEYNIHKITIKRIIHGKRGYKYI